jgi:hypothetical protein
MRVSKCVVAFAAAALLALPVAAAIKAMTLKEIMEITQDTVHGTIVDREVISLDWPREGAVYTQLTVEGESLRTGKAKTVKVVFHGSHRTEDWYGVSSMPTLQDTRLHGETVLFHYEHPLLPGHNLVPNLAALYRVERGFGEPVLVGKGEGAAFAENTALTSVREQVRATHVELSRAVKAPGLNK